MRIWVLFLLLWSVTLWGASKHRRDGSLLPPKEKEFASQLSIRERKIFCGRFNAKQREMALNLARGRGKDSCATPDEAVLQVMEETGMSLAVKGRRESEETQ